MKKITLFILMVLFVFSCENNAAKQTSPAPAPVEKQLEEKDASREKEKQSEPTKEVSPPRVKEEGDNTITGIFKYMADAAIFKDCATDKKMSVAMEQGYLNLEKTYLRTVDGGTPVLIIVDGSIKTRKAMEGGKTESVLVVRKLLSLQKDKSCADK